MSEQKKRFAPPAEFSAKAHVKSLEQYQEMYTESITDPDGFWLKQTTELLDWFKVPTKGCDSTLTPSTDEMGIVLSCPFVATAINCICSVSRTAA